MIAKLATLRADLVDGVTTVARCLDARRERDRLRETVERLTTERDEYAQSVSVLACRIDRVQQERDAARAECGRLREALDLNQRSCEASNAGHESLRRDLSALLTGSHPPLTSQDVVQRVQAVIDERDARIPTDIDGAQAWAAKRGVLVQGGRRDTDWHCVVMSGEVVQRTNNRADAVHIAVWHSLHGMWRSDA